MSDIVERLRIHSDTEEVMRAWDRLRAYLLDGNKGSYARDIFEAILSHIDEGREEAADEIELLRKSVDCSIHPGVYTSYEAGKLAEDRTAKAKWNTRSDAEFLAKETEALGYLRAVRELQARCANLEKALEPFASVKFPEGNIPDMSNVHGLGVEEQLRAADFRAAASALRPTTAEESKG